MKLSISQASEQIGICADTLRNWVAKGIAKPEFTPKGHTRYTMEEVSRLKSLYEDYKRAQANMGVRRIVD